MKYDEALRRWGEKQLRENNFQGNRLTIIPETITVAIKFSAGNPCCGGRDADCYCSLAEDPSASVEISARTAGGGFAVHRIEPQNFDFQMVLHQLLEIADGTITR